MTGAAAADVVAVVVVGCDAVVGRCTFAGAAAV